MNPSDIFKTLLPQILGAASKAGNEALSRTVETALAASKGKALTIQVSVGADIDGDHKPDMVVANIQGRFELTPDGPRFDLRSVEVLP